MYRHFCLLNKIYNFIATYNDILGYLQKIFSSGALRGVPTLVAMRTKEQAPKCCPPAEGVTGRPGYGLLRYARNDVCRGCRQRTTVQGECRDRPLAGWHDRAEQLGL